MDYTQQIFLENHVNGPRRCDSEYTVGQGENLQQTNYEKVKYLCPARLGFLVHKQSQERTDNNIYTNYQP